MENDIVYSHFVAGLSGGFPPGEEGFIRSVRKFSDQITDPVLKSVSQASSDKSRCTDKSTGGSTRS